MKSRMTFWKKISIKNKKQTIDIISEPFPKEDDGISA